MDFFSDSFPNDQVHISYFELATRHQEANGSMPAEALQLLHAQQKKRAGKMVIVNAEQVASLFHLNLAISRALINQRDQLGLNDSNQPKSGKGLRTQNLGQEVLYCLHPKHSINHALDVFGIPKVKKAFFLVALNA